MKTKHHKIYVIGAGISGLIAAKTLEDNGYHPTILESTDRAGGRVKTDIVSGYQMDHGFQVLLTAYPAAQKYLNFESLELQYFLPGAAVFANGNQKVLGDPLRNFSLLWPTLFSGIGTITDKIKILKLNSNLKNTKLDTIFVKPEKTTLQYLRDFGFSEEMITKFFKPFFSGIFLESELETSSRMFEFVYKMFGEGFASLPKAGIEAIPRQLEANLKQTTFHFNTTVKAVEQNKIILSDGIELDSDYTIIATEASYLIRNLKGQETEWKSCETFYFETETKTISKPLIGLITDKDALINNIFYHNSLETYSKGTKELISVTIVKKHNLSDESLPQQVEKELKQYCKITSVKFLKKYKISKALPKLENLQYENEPSVTKLTNSIFLAGDIQLNASLNAAMISGEKAGLGVVEAILAE